MPHPFEILTIVSAPYEENTYLVYLPATRDAFVVDPGMQPELILREVDRLDLRIEAILNTHGHLDHIAGNGAMKERFPDAPILIGAGEADFLTDPRLNLSILSGLPIVSPPADRLVQHGEVIELLGLQWSVRDVPGHSPGHVVYLYDAEHPPILFAGDTVMAGTIGRTDFPGGDLRQLLKNIQEQIYTLPEDTVILPGHQGATFVGHERRSNPFTNMTW